MSYDEVAKQLAAGPDPVITWPLLAIGIGLCIVAMALIAAL